MKKAILFAAICFHFSLAAQGRYLGPDYSASCKDQTPAESEAPPLNKMVLEAAKSMPTGLGYEAKKDVERIEALKEAVTCQGERIRVNAEKAGESFCSAGTYMVFLKVIGSLQQKRQVRLSEQSKKAYCVQSKAPNGQLDGYGIWGRWNSDGPGTAVVFKDLNLGYNFSDITRALPGDFMKINFKDGGGHSVVFDSRRMCKTCEKCAYEEHVCFWSTNTWNDSQYPRDGKVKLADGKWLNGGWSLKCSAKKLMDENDFTLSRFDPARIQNLDLAGTNVGADASQPNFIVPKLVQGARATKADYQKLVYGPGGVSSGPPASRPATMANR